MNEIIEKFKALVRECEEKLKSLTEAESEIGKVKIEQAERERKIEEREKAVAERESKIELTEDLSKYKAELDKREFAIKLKEEESAKGILEREKAVNKAEADVKERDKQLADIQADIVKQREALEKEKKEFKTKIIAELDQQYNKKKDKTA